MEALSKEVVLQEFQKIKSKNDNKVNKKLFESEKKNKEKGRRKKKNFISKKINRILISKGYKEKD